MDVTEYIDFWTKNIVPEKDNCVYIDIPFCEEKCGFCIYNSYYFNKENLDEYLGYLQLWINYYNIIFLDFSPQKIYFGGGTASILTENKLIELFQQINGFERINYKSFEAHPLSLSNDKIALLSKYGFNYYSVGIQSFSKELIYKMNRRYVSPEILKKCIDCIHFNDGVISVDLIAYMDEVSFKSLEILINDINLLMDYCSPDIICIHPMYQRIDYLSTGAEKINALKNLALCIKQIIEKNNQYLWDEEYNYFYNNIENDDVIINWGNNSHNLYCLDNKPKTDNLKKYNCNYTISYPNKSVFAIGGYRDRVVHSHLYGKHWTINISRNLVSITN